MPPTTVKMTVSWELPVGEARAIADALHQVMLDARQQPGCLTCAVAIEVAQSAGVRFVEQWADEASLQRELRSARFTRLASLIESSSEPPLIEFLLPAGPQGLDYARRVLAGRGDQS